MARVTLPAWSCAIEGRGVWIGLWWSCGRKELKEEATGLRDLTGGGVSVLLCSCGWEREIKRMTDSGVEVTTVLGLDGGGRGWVRSSWRHFWRGGWTGGCGTAVAHNGED